MRRLLLTDSEPRQLHAYAGELGERYDVRVCGCGPEVLEEYYAFKPELMVLDTAMPGCDAHSLLQAIRSSDTETGVLATVCGVNKAVTEMLSEARVELALIKPCDGIMLRTRLRELERIMECSRRHRRSSRVSGALRELGLDCSQVGFACLTAAVLYFMDHPGCLFSDELCPYVAKLCGGTASSVERAMRRCIAHGWAKRDPQIWTWYFGKGCPTGARFIKTLAQKLG